MRAQRALLLAGCIAVALATPLLPSFYISIVTKILIISLFAVSLDLLLGYTGLPCFGHAAFFGVAAYAVALLTTHYRFGFWTAMLSGLAASVLLAIVFALLTARARGGYFLMLTLALSQVVWGLAFGWRDLTNGEDGISGVRRPSILGGIELAGDASFYYLVLTFFVSSLALLWLVIQSPFGRALVGIRDNELRMRVLGYNVLVFHCAVFALSGLFAGLAGVLYAYFNGFVSPTFLGVALSAQALLMVLLGGAGTLFGAIIGAGLVIGLETFLSTLLERWLLVFGVIYVLVALYAPGGLLEFLRKWGNRA